MTAPAIYAGIQEGYGHMPAIELYTLQAPVGEHPAGSTVSRLTLEQHGYVLGPRRPSQKSPRKLGRKIA